MQRKPRLSGLSGSPLTLTRRPSSTSTRMPHSVGWHFIGHIVRNTPVGLFGMPYRIVEAALTGIVVDAILRGEPMNFDFDAIVDRRGTDSNKWHKFGPDVLPLWVADMDFASPPAVVDALRARVEHGRSEEHTSELQSHSDLVCRLL